jgi:tRNA(Ile)-lysidine synthase
VIPARALGAVRSAVRGAIGALSPGDLLLVACSGGADSLALAAATALEAPRAGLRAGAVTVDHGLQAGSPERATAVASTCRHLGLDPVQIAAVTVGSAGGPEGAARDARRGALLEAARRTGAVAVLLGHSLDDQAETVLLGLARGSGARSLAGMAPVSGPAGVFLRPLLDLPRSVLAQACTEAGLEPWADPHNTDPRYARVRVRTRALPVLETELGPGVAAALARSAALLRADADALDAWAARAAQAAQASRQAMPAPGRLRIDALETLPTAVRRRVLRGAALAAGCPAGALSAAHVAAVDALVTNWHGQGPLDLPGGVRASRACGSLLLAHPGL